ncbi:MAG: homoserine dehydrogenase [Phascolarctobacterium sp.]|nr:homoserine dehydrogenase [Phascolarctobacterium sp.]
MAKKEKIVVGLLGAGTVGGGVLKVLEKNAADIAKKAGVEIVISKVMGLDIEGMKKEFGEGHIYTKNFADIVDDPEIDIVVELIGREHPAKEFIKEALEKGKNVVTANKDVIAKFGKELFPIAAEHGVDLMFEASVCGGIPIIEPMRNVMSCNKIKSIMGIVNGTTNYMLSKMSNEHLDYDEVLKEAQAKGYAESDPTADVGGLDAARKMAILSSLAFNMDIDLDDVYVEGIEKIQACDIKYAQDLGYCVKLLGIAKYTDSFGASARVTPAMLPVDHPLATVNGVYNAVFVKGDAIGEAMFLGLGAGRFPTASSVVGDIMTVARNINAGATGRLGMVQYREKRLCPPEAMTSPSYIRMSVLDQPGALAAIAAAFAAQNVSLRNVIQKDNNGGTDIVIITHAVSRSSLEMALLQLNVLPVVEKICCVISVEDRNLE